MNRRGVALLLVLWLLVLLTGLATLSLGGVRIGSAAGRNRIGLLKAGWAREACLEILLGRAANRPDSLEPEELGLDSVDLGDEVWCRAEVSDPGERANLNLASREALIALVGNPSLADTLIEGRPWPATDALPALPSLAHAASGRWVELLTVRGTGRINLNRAPPDVLATLPGIDPDAARHLSRRRMAMRFRTVEEAIAGLPPSARQQVLTRYQAFSNLVTVQPEQLTVLLSGRIRDGPLIARATVTLVPAGSRLAVVRRETE